MIGIYDDLLTSESGLFISVHQVVHWDRVRPIVLGYLRREWLPGVLDFGGLFEFFLLGQEFWARCLVFGRQFSFKDWSWLNCCTVWSDLRTIFISLLMNKLLLVLIYHIFLRIASSLFFICFRIRLVRRNCVQRPTF